jgi:hypothetical protein
MNTIPYVKDTQYELRVVSVNSGIITIRNTLLDCMAFLQVGT